MTFQRMMFALMLAWFGIFQNIQAVPLPPEPEVEALRETFMTLRSDQAKTELLLSFIEDRARIDAPRLEAIKLIIPLANQEHTGRILEVAARRDDAPDVVCAAMRAAWQLTLEDLEPEPRITRLRQAARGEYSGNLPLNEVTRAWASDELCNLGVTEAFKEVRDFIISSGDGEPIESVRFCKERMDAISTTNTIEEAYIKALRQAGPDTSRWLGSWAFEHLKAIDSKVVEDAFVEVAKSEMEQKRRRLYDQIYFELQRRGWKNEQLRDRGLTWLLAVP